jgi:hypothetical protein
MQGMPQSKTLPEARMKKRLPESLLYFLAFFLIAALCFYRIFTEGAIPIFGDGFLWIYPMQLFNVQSGLMPPLWNPYMFAGMPFVELMQTAALYPPNIILYAVLPAPQAFNASLLLHYALAGFSTFLLLRELGLNRTSAFFGATFFAFSGFMISFKQHVAILNSAAWLPLIVYFAERSKRTLSIRYSMGFALAIAAQVLAGNFQICVYTYIVLAVYFAFSVFGVESGRRLRFVMLGAVGVVLGFLMAFPQIYATWQMSGLSLRPVIKETLGHIFTKEFHVYLKTLPSMVFPHLYLGGEFGTILPVPGFNRIVFVGILPLSLAVLALIKGFRKSNTVRLWAVVGLLGLVLATADDTPLGELLFHVPVYGMFHANGRNILEFSLAVSVLFAIGMEYVLSDRRYVKTALKVLAGVAAASALSLAITYLAVGEEAERAITPSNPAVYVPIAFFVLYALGLGLYHTKKKRVVVYALLAVVLAEAYTFGASYEAGWTPKGALADRCEEKGYDFLKSVGGNEPFRVAFVGTETMDQFNVPCGVNMFSSYDQLIFADYAMLFDLEPLGYSRYWENLVRNNALLSMMNVKYLVVPASVKLRLDDVVTVTERVRAEAPVAAWPGPFYLPDPGDRTRNRMKLKTRLAEGTYVATLRAASGKGGRASLNMEIYRKEQADLRDDRLPLNAYPGVIGEGHEEYYRIYQSEKPDTVMLSFAAPRKDDIEMRDIAVLKLEGYGPPPIATSGRIYEHLKEAAGYDIYLNKNALPRAYSVTGLIGARDIHELKRMFDLILVNPASHAVLFNEDFKEIGGTEFSKAGVSVEEYENDRVVIRTSAAGQSFVVLADQYYPGWKALIDGKESRIWKANGVLRGVVVPGGEHEVVFEYSPLWFKASISAALVIAAAALVIIFITRKEGEA